MFSVWDLVGVGSDGYLSHIGHVHMDNLTGNAVLAARVGNHHAVDYDSVKGAYFHADVYMRTAVQAV